MTDKSGRNLLMIAYKFPPMHNTSCVRTWGFYQHIKPYFNTVTVISTSNRHILRQDAVDLTNAEIFDARTLDYRTVLQRRETKQSVFDDDSKESVIGKIALKFNASYPFLYLFGEGGIKYIRSALRIGEKLIVEKSITHVFSTFSPYADHVIANKLKAKFPSLFWIADFRDLHVDPTQDNLLLRQVQRNWNKKMLKAADVVTTVSDGLALHLKAFNSEIYVLRNGIDKLSDDDTSVYDDKFTIAYTGSMYGERRNPNIVLQALTELLEGQMIPRNKLRLTYAGKDSEIWLRRVKEFGLTDIFDNRGLISRKEALDIQRRSSINLLLTHSDPNLTGNLTGKIFEYFNARRKILVMINGPRDIEIENLVSAESGRVFYNGDAQQVRGFILEQYDEWNAGNSSQESAGYNAKLQQFTWVHVIEKFAGYIGLA